MKLVELERELKRLPLKQVYLLVSSEAYFIDSALDSIMAAIHDHADGNEIERNVFTVRDIHAQEIVNHALTYPFFGATKVIIVRHLDTASKADFQVYEEYFTEPSDCSIVIFTASKVDARLKAVKQAKSAGFLYQFDMPREYEMPSLIKREIVARYGKQIDDEGSVLLSEMIGLNLDSLRSELEKLVLYIGEKPQATIEDVATMVGHTAVINTFKMIDALSLKDAKQALSMLLQLLNQHQEPPERLLGGLKWQFNRLYGIKKSMALGKSIADAFSDFKVYRGQQANVQKQLSTFSLEQLSRIYQSLYMTERKMKSTGENPQILLERFFFKTLLA